MKTLDRFKRQTEYTINMWPKQVPLYHSDRAFRDRARGLGFKSFLGQAFLGQAITCLNLLLVIIIKERPPN